MMQIRSSLLRPNQLEIRTKLQQREGKTLESQNFSNLSKASALNFNKLQENKTCCCQPNHKQRAEISRWDMKNPKSNEQKKRKTPCSQSRLQVRNWPPSSHDANTTSPSCLGNQFSLISTLQVFAREGLRARTTSPGEFFGWLASGRVKWGAGLHCHGAGNINVVFLARERGIEGPFVPVFACAAPSSPHLGTAPESRGSVA